MRLTTVRLLFMGWKVQHSSSLDSGSLTSRMQRPSSVFQIRRVPSSDVDTMMSLLRDQAKSVTGPPWPFSITFTLAGGGDNVMIDRVPSNEQQARRCLSSLANCNRGTERTHRRTTRWNKVKFTLKTKFINDCYDFITLYSPAESTCWSNMWCMPAKA